MKSPARDRISICLNRGREESVGNDDVSIVCASKYEMVSTKNTDIVFFFFLSVSGKSHT